MAWSTPCQTLVQYVYACCTGAALKSELAVGLSGRAWVASPMCYCRLLLQILVEHHSSSSLFLGAGAALKFELAVGLNGRVWVASPDVQTAIVVVNAVQQSEALSEAQVKIFVKARGCNLVGFVNSGLWHQLAAEVPSTLSQMVLHGVRWWAGSERMLAPSDCPVVIATEACQQSSILCRRGCWIGCQRQSQRRSEGVGAEGAAHVKIVQREWKMYPRAAVTQYEKCESGSRGALGRRSTPSRRWNARQGEGDAIGVGCVYARGGVLLPCAAAAPVTRQPAGAGQL